MCPIKSIQQNLVIDHVSTMPMEDAYAKILQNGRQEEEKTSFDEGIATGHAENESSFHTSYKEIFAERK